MLYKCLYYCFRAFIWRRNIRNKGIDHLTHAELRKLRVCGQHFTDDQYMCPAERYKPRSRLNCNAVPTSVNCPYPPVPYNIKRKRPLDRSSLNVLPKQVHHRCLPADESMATAADAGDSTVISDASDKASQTPII
jgi:hypothetical protein